MTKVLSLKNSLTQPHACTHAHTHKHAHKHIHIDKHKHSMLTWSVFLAGLVLRTREAILMN